MRRDRSGIRNEIRGNRDGRGSCAYARAGNTDNERKPNGEDNKKHNSAGNIQGIPENQERDTVGRESVDKRILREHSGAVRK